MRSSIAAVTTPMHVSNTNAFKKGLRTSIVSGKHHLKGAVQCEYLPFGLYALLQEAYMVTGRRERGVGWGGGRGGSREHSVYSRTKQDRV